MEFMPEHAPLVAMAFLGTLGLLALLVLFVLVALWTRKKWVGIGAIVLGLALASGYALVLVGVSLTSHEKVLALGEHKYFCEIDCHIAYSITSVEETSALGDELHPTSAAAQAALAKLRGVTTPLSQPLRPGESYVTHVVFDIPSNLRNPRLFIGDDLGFPNSVLIGHEDSYFHKKILLALAATDTISAGRVP